MRKLLIVAFMFAISKVSAQDLNWNTITYTTGNLSPNFGLIGSPAAFVSLNITGNTNRINGGFPVKYAADPPGTGNDCAVNCALRSSVTFIALNETIIYTFTFTSAVTTLSFTMYDIDGDNTSGDRANVSATGPGGSCTITMSNVNTPSSTITGNGTTSATVTGTQGNTTDHVTNVSVSGSIGTLAIVYSLNPANPSAGNRSFSIRNINWAAVLPVKWISFTGEREQTGQIKLKWITSDENNVREYLIERSKNNRDFIVIGSLSPRNSSISVSSYVFTDQAPGAGNTFYRIIQYDLSGERNISSVLLVREKNDRAILIIYPNPASELIYFNAAYGQVLQTDIYDLLGRRMLQQNSSINSIDISKLQSGSYILNVKFRDGSVLRGIFVK